MTRQEHNEYWGVNHAPTDEVLCNTLGYGELSQYDPLCGKCWLGHQHDWAEHDRQIAFHFAHQVPQPTQVAQ